MSPTAPAIREAAARPAGPKARRSFFQGSFVCDPRVASRLLIALVIPVFMVGYLVRPDSVTSDRVGVSIVEAVNAAKGLADCLELGLTSGGYALFNLVVPFDLDTMGEWDILLAAVGGVYLFAAALWFSKNPRLRVDHAVFFLAATGLSAIYIFMINKDFTQLCIFTLAFFVARSSWRPAVRVAAIVLLFAAEAATWRSYFYIVAFFVPVVFVAIRWFYGQQEIERVSLVKAAGVLILLMLVFAFAVKFISPSDYATIVEQHGDSRESYTGTAASGIVSLIDVDGSSPVPLFVLNWAINTVRIALPIELFLKSPYYWVFAVYQLYITYGVVRTVASRPADVRVRIALAVYLAFLLASGTFEPDFGSWVRHETALLLFLAVVVTGYAGRPKDVASGARISGEELLAR